MPNEAQGLLLGPIVGHTDSRSTCIWIRVDGDPADWSLEIEGRLSPFQPTDPQRNEFGTGLARFEGLAPDTRYTYAVRKRASAQPVASGGFRTFPANDSTDDLNFVTLSCNDDREPNAWQRLAQYIRDSEPRFILMVGDQVYVDEGEDNAWDKHLDSSSEERRRILAGKHQKLWCTEPLATIMANTPVYMTWDDHDIRDGWGSFAGDSATLAARYPAGEAIYEQHQAFFLDTYDVNYHFQTCHNPHPRDMEGDLARPFAIRCGRLMLIVPDSRSDRDFAREGEAILGRQQWQWLESTAGEMPDDIEVIAVGTSVPIVDLDPEGKIHRMFRGRTDDIELFAKGDMQGLEELRNKRDNPLLTLPILLSTAIDHEFTLAKRLGFRVADLDDVRDKWSYESNQAEQERLLNLFTEAAIRERTPDAYRSLLFLAGDIHVGALFDIEMKRYGLTAQCLISSGIAKSAPIPTTVGVLVDKDFDALPDVHASLRFVVNAVNFATTRIVFSGGKAMLQNGIVYEDGAKAEWEAESQPEEKT